MSLDVFWSKHRACWVVPYKDSSNKLRQHGVPRELAPACNGVGRAAAREYANGWRTQQRATPIPAAKARGGVTVRDLRDRWLALRRSARIDGKAMFKASTLAGYTETIDSRALKPLVCDGKPVTLGDVPLADWDAPMLRAWVRALRAAVSTSRCRNVVSTLTSLVDDAIAERWVAIVTNPLRSPLVLRELPEQRRKSGRDPVVVPLECLQAVVCCDRVPAQRRVRHLVEACTGLNEGEIAGRAWKDVALDARPTISVTSAVLVRDTRTQAQSETKNEHRVRTIPLHEEATRALRWWRDVGWPDAYGWLPRPSDPIFPGRGGRFARPPSARHLRDDLELAGCPSKGITAQALRRVFATALADAGVPLDVRQALMGHRPETVTASAYTGAAVERYREPVNRIPLRWVEPLVPGLVPDVVPAAQDPAFPSSHLRDLNSRPTVYEAVTVLGHNGHSRSRLRQTPRESGDRNGAGDANGGGFVPGLVPGGGGERGGRRVHVRPWQVEAQRGPASGSLPGGDLPVQEVQLGEHRGRGTEPARRPEGASAAGGAIPDRRGGHGDARPAALVPDARGAAAGQGAEVASLATSLAALRCGDAALEAWAVEMEET